MNWKPCIAASTLAVLLMFPAGSGASTFHVSETEGAAPAEVKAGDTLLVGSYGLGGIVPRQGEVAIANYGGSPDGSFPGTTVVFTNNGGQVSYVTRHGGKEIDDSIKRSNGQPRASRTALTNTNECTSGTHGFLGWVQPSPFTWRVSSTGMPTSLSLKNTENATVYAMQSWTTVRDNCGFSDTVGLSTTRAASNASSPGVGVSGAGTFVCNPDNDGIAEVGFKYAPNSPASALTCSGGLGGYFTYTDTALNTQYAWMNHTGATCSSKLYVDDVVAHEFGHMLGLDDANSWTSNSMYGTLQRKLWDVFYHA